MAGAAAALAAVEQGRKGGARGERGDFSGRLLKLDANSDLAVSVDEYLSRRSARFGKLDIDGNGALDPSEVGAGAEERSMKRFEQLMQRADLNKDSKITREELDKVPSARAAADGKAQSPGRGGERRAARLAKMFETFDRNGDGVVELTEFDAARAERTDYAKRRAMHVNDKDRDGKVTLQEFTLDPRERFARMDLDGDGKITAPDLPPDFRWQWIKR